MKQAQPVRYDSEFTIALVAILLMIAVTLVGLRLPQLQQGPTASTPSQTTQTADMQQDQAG